MAGERERRLSGAVGIVSGGGRRLSVAVIIGSGRARGAEKGGGPVARPLMGR
jgi:hypothetical protein